jgi:aldose 1-epimerase
MVQLTYGILCGLRGKSGATTAVALAISALALVVASETANAGAALDHSHYGTTQGGQQVDIYTLTNDRGQRVRFLSYGSTISC